MATLFWVVLVAVAFIALFKISEPEKKPEVQVKSVLYKDYVILDDDTILYPKHIDIIV